MPGCRRRSSNRYTDLKSVSPSKEGPAGKTYKQHERARRTGNPKKQKVKNPGRNTQRRKMQSQKETEKNEKQSQPKDESSNSGSKRRKESRDYADRRWIYSPAHIEGAQT
eukprot:GHVU01012980.1.p1 GENE.GHVU01012980.1~~GHVU01012980.1.p1  ORF type:complete len:110 (-),score=15.97 GHVU01012980.1:441-770(-)